VPLPQQQPATPGVAPPNIAVVVMCFDRADYLERTLRSLLSVALPLGMTLYISEDGSDPRVAAVARHHPQFRFMQHRRDENRLDTGESVNTLEGPAVYYRIAAHYRFAFSKVMDQYRHDYIVFVEDDMEIAPDFFSYFQATLPLINSDPTIWAVSSWNDNGQAQFVADPQLLVRADFFPGLGWGTSKRVWRELARKWPHGYWDDWMREPPQRMGRATIRPEISRTRNFGAQGASDGQFFEQYIASIQLNTLPISWSTEDLAYLLKAQYDAEFLRAVRAAQTITVLQQIPTRAVVGQVQDFRIEYQTLLQYEGLAEANGLMPDSKAGVPRCGYLNIVMIRYLGHRVFYTPPLSTLPMRL